MRKEVFSLVKQCGDRKQGLCQCTGSAMPWHTDEMPRQRVVIRILHQPTLFLGGRWATAWKLEAFLQMVITVSANPVNALGNQISVWVGSELNLNQQTKASCPEGSGDMRPELGREERGRM